MEDEQPAREANKICGVCGDRALGYNFNAVSCESCKAFFRRNALKNKDFRCPFTENCNITPVTRRFCQKCRLDKCFSIGMRKEYIMSEEDKVLKRQKIEQNRARKRPGSENAKPSKSKKSCLEDCNYDDTSVSVASVASVASTISDTYFWESDRKYTDLDANRQTATETMSPVTAASAPSPSSPRESASITGSKMLDVLKESSHNNNGNFGTFKQSSLQYVENEDDVEITGINSDIAAVQSQLTFNEYNLLSENVEDQKSVICSETIEQKALGSRSEFGIISNNKSPTYSLELENTSNYSKLEKNRVDKSPYTDHALSPETILPDQNPLEESTICTQSVDRCSKKSTVTDLTKDPNLVVKFASNPSVIARIFQDRDLVLKIMTDPTVIAKLAGEPQFLQILEENSGVAKRETKSESDNNNKFDEDVKNSNISNNIYKEASKGKQSHIENPILTDLITNSTYEESAVSSFHEAPSTSHSWNKGVTNVTTKDVLQDVRSEPIAANSIESILCEAIKLEFSAYSTLGGIQPRRELNDAERAKLNELIVANKALLTPLDEEIIHLVGDDCKLKSAFGTSDPALLDVINLTSIAIRRLIKMAKRIHAFKNMCQEDQIALLKGGCTEMMILRSAINYDPEKDMWRIPHSREMMSSIKTDVLKKAKGNLYSEHTRFIRSFDSRWRDENIILILSAIALFTADRPKVVHSDVIKLEQNSYYYLLRRYLESVYPGCEAKSMFLKLIQKISELHRLNNEVVGVYLNVNPVNVEPLLIEIFDLNH